MTPILNTPAGARLSRSTFSEPPPEPMISPRPQAKPFLPNKTLIGGVAWGQVSPFFCQNCVWPFIEFQSGAIPTISCRTEGSRRSVADAEWRLHRKNKSEASRFTRPRFLGGIRGQSKAGVHLRRVTAAGRKPG